MTGKDAEIIDLTDELDEGEVPPSPVRPQTPELPSSDHLKGTEEDFGEFLLDRTESFFDCNAIEMDTSMNSTGDTASSLWSDRLMTGLLTPTSADAKKEKSAKKPRKKNVCWNCDGDHIMTQCTEARNPKKIRENKAIFLKIKEGRNNEPRYHAESTTEGEQKKYRPGVISDDLRAALGIEKNAVHPWIYRMRKMGFGKGYPPGYLKKALERDTTNEVLRFVSDDAPEEEEVKSGPPSPPPVIVPHKIFYYHGFNNQYRGLVDNDSSQFRVPPFDVFIEMLQKEQDDLHKERQLVKLQLNALKRIGGDSANGGPTPNKRMRFDSDDDIQLLPPPPPPPMNGGGGGDDSDVMVIESSDEDVIVLDTTPRTPDTDSGLESSFVVDSSVVKTDNESITETVSLGKGSSTGIISGTPVLMRKSAVDGNAVKAERPDLTKFSEGIVPFGYEEEPSLRKGFFKKMMNTIRSKLPGSSKK